MIYLDSHHDAQSHNLRPCKRCRPDLQIGPHQAFHEFVMNQLVLLADQHPEHNIAHYADSLAISVRQLERIVHAHTGSSPRKFLSDQHPPLSKD